MEKQVDKKHYSLGSYVHPERFASYSYQLREIEKASPRSVLEIGVGDGVIGDYMRRNTDISYTSVDIDPELKPDVVGSVLELPFADGSYDVVCAFEVLEHIPFESFGAAVAEMTRVARSRVFISVPHFGPPLRFLFKMPKFGLKFSWKIPYHPKHEWNGQHYWEIGKKGYPVKAVREVLEKHGRLVGDYVPFESQYHHFFILEKK
ncbi:MAG: class I SAM-dependent methyltransferase [Patescibacteria group bacterium]|nr:class I SAM-dependent methyltransferase [Patescibacteria group bacterium]MDE2116763.1 class I SAM-dependent methyltransferase [Patescibacteria group bacterium]